MRVLCQVVCLIRVGVVGCDAVGVCAGWLLIGELDGDALQSPGPVASLVGPNLAFVALDHRAVLALAYEALVGVEILGMLIFKREEELLVGIEEPLADVGVGVVRGVVVHLEKNLGEGHVLLGMLPRVKPAALAATAVEPEDVEVLVGPREDLVQGFPRGLLALARGFHVELEEPLQELSLDLGVARCRAIVHDVRSLRL